MGICGRLPWAAETTVVRHTVSVLLAGVVFEGVLSDLSFKRSCVSKALFDLDL